MPFCLSIKSMILYICSFYSTALITTVSLLHEWELHDDEREDILDTLIELVVFSLVTPHGYQYTNHA